MEGAQGAEKSAGAPSFLIPDYLEDFERTTMGAMTLAGDVDRSLVNAAFKNCQEEDRFENGHSYSGGFGMARGLLFAVLEFPDAGAARDWLEAIAGNRRKPRRYASTTKGQPCG